MMILRAGFLGPHVIATSVFLAALVILFCGFAYQIGRLVLGEQAARSRVPRRSGDARLGRGRHARRGAPRDRLDVLPAWTADGSDPRGCRGRLGGGMSTVTTAVAAALRIAEHSIREPRPGEVAIEVPCGGPARACRRGRGRSGRPAPVAVCRRRAGHARTLRRASRLVAATARDVSVHLGSGRSGRRPRFRRSPRGIPPRTGSSGR